MAPLVAQGVLKWAGRSLLLLLGPLLMRLRSMDNRHLLVVDTLMLSATPTVALLIIREGEVSFASDSIALLCYTVAGIAVRVGLLALFGLYRRYWRGATLDEFALTAFAGTLSSACLMAFAFAMGNFSAYGSGLPRSFALAEGLLAITVICGARASIRVAHRLLRVPTADDARRLLVVGAGSVGQMVVRELQANPRHGLAPVAFLDDDPTKQGTRILNVPVVGGIDALAEAANAHGVAEVLIAMSAAQGGVVRECLRASKQAGLPARIVPAMQAILCGSVDISQLRGVQIEDLLRRDPIITDTAAVRDLIRGKRVLITGAGGSIGSELCRQLLACNPAEMALLGHGENSVFEIHNELQRLEQAKLPTCASAGDEENVKFHAIIADLSMPKRLNRLVTDFRPHVIFHAAAHKHVPLMELHPVEALANNVLGTRNLLEAAELSGVEHFVMISTDKAVNPTSIMGASKRAAELLVLDTARRVGKPYVVVRFGNVLGSRGSVVLTFQRQIKDGGPVTVSHPEMTRFFMTIPEAVQLVLQSAVIGTGGEVFLLDMGEPVKIVDLARDLIQLSGLEVGRDIEIVFNGIRPGEKLYEELFIEGESYGRTRHEKVLLARNASSFVPPSLARSVELLSVAVENDDRYGAVELLRQLVPEYQPDTAPRATAGSYR